MTKVTLYSGSNRQGVREHIEAYQELIRAVDSERLTIDSCSPSKYRERQSRYIRMSLHTSSMSTLTDLTRALNDSQSSSLDIEYQCCLDHLDYETFKKKSLKHEGSNLDFSTPCVTVDGIQTLNSRINELRDKIQKHKEPVYRYPVSNSTTLTVSKSSPDRYALKILSEKHQIITRLNAELKSLKDQLALQKDELDQQKKEKFALLLDGLSEQMTYDETLWMSDSAVADLAFKLTPEELVEPSYDDVFFKPMLVFHQMHHLCRNSNCDSGISLNYNNVTMVIPASEKGRAEHIFLEGDHQDEKAREIRFHDAAEHLVAKVQSLATDSVSSGKAFHFVDDQYAQTVLDFFKKHPQLIPPGITLHCHHYNYNDHVIRQQAVDSIFKTIGTVSNIPSMNCHHGSIFSADSSGDVVRRGECAKTLGHMIDCMTQCCRK